MHHFKRLFFLKLFIAAFVLLGVGFWFSPGNVRESLLRIVFNVPASLEIKVGKRSAEVFLPEQYDPAKIFPLVIALHGYQSSPVENDYIFDLIGPRHELGYILLAPKGLVDRKGNRYWRAIPDCCNYELYDNDDLSYLTDLIDKAIESLAVDPKHIILMGFSNGSYMGYRLLCEPPTKITHFISIAGLAPQDLSQCKPDQPTNLFHFHGLADQRVRYDARDHLASPMEETLQFWAGVNACETPPEKIPAAYDLIDDAMGNETELWQWKCQKAQIQLFRMHEVGHLPWMKESPLRLLWPTLMEPKLSLAAPELEP